MLLLIVEVTIKDRRNKSIQTLDCFIAGGQILVFEAELGFEMKIPEIVLRTGGRGETGRQGCRLAGLQGSWIFMIIFIYNILAVSTLNIFFNCF